jgi:hypothetical protein
LLLLKEAPSIDKKIQYEVLSQTLVVHCEISGCHNVIAEDAGLLRCDTVLSDD